MPKEILIVDDSPLIHKLLGRALEAGGYKVCGNAKNGREAVELYDALLPDCVFMDITMPVMNGMEASRAIKAAHPDSRIVMLTAMGDDEMMAEAKAAGVDVFLKKPFKDENVIEVLAVVLP